MDSTGGLLCKAKLFSSKDPLISLIRSPGGCSKTTDGHTAILLLGGGFGGDEIGGDLGLLGVQVPVVSGVLTCLYFFHNLVDCRLFLDQLTIYYVGRFFESLLNLFWRAL